MKRYFTYFLLFISILILFTKGYSQNGVFLLGGTEYTGATYKYKFQQDGRILKRNWYGDLNAQFAIHSKIHYRFSKYFGLEGELQFEEMDLVVHDKFFINKNNIGNNNSSSNNNSNTNTNSSSKRNFSNGNFDVIKWYFSPQLAGYFFYHIESSNIHPYLSGGISYNYLMSHPQSNSSFLYKPTNENLQLSSHFSTQYMSKFLALGIFIHNRNRPIGSPRYFIGFKYYFAGNFTSGDYQNVQNGNVLYKDHVVASGSYLAFTFSMGGTLIHINKKTPHPKHSWQPKESHKTKKDSHQKINPKIPASDTIPKEIKGRTVEVAKIIKVKSNSITIKVWDHETVDGDVLSLNLNGAWILEDYLLNHQQKILQQHLNNGVNYLVLHAKNEGKYKPCTSAIIIDDGYSSQMVVLNSNFGTSQAIEIHVEE